jgi:hypothetical protein
MSWRDEAQHYPEQDIRAKFHELAGTVLTDEGVAEVENAIDQAERWTSVGDFIILLRRNERIRP